MSTGTANGTISVNTNGTAANVSVYGLGTAAYTNSSAYAASGHTHALISALESLTSSSKDIVGFVKVDNSGNWSVDNTTYLTSHQSLANYSTKSNTIKALSISGKTITYTKGDDTTGTLTTQDTNTTYSAGTGLSLSSTTFSLASGVATAGTAGTSSATSGSTLAVPYVTVDTYGRVTGYGTHTHTISGFLTSHQDISGKLDKSGGTMTGNLCIGDGVNTLLWRSNTSYASGVYYHTTGNEAVVFANKNTVTSWIFANTNPTTRANWRELTPGLQIKNNKVAINKLIDNGTEGTYTLDVNGTANATTLYENGTSLASKYATASHTHTKSDITDFESNAWLLKGGTAIPNNDTTKDLNSYTTFGNYYCDSNTYSQYITNKPVSGNAAFILKVYSSLGSGDNYIRQDYYRYADNRRFTRWSTNKGSTWSAWEEFSLVGHTHSQYLTSHQSLADYATKTYVTNAITTTINANY